jgi:uncharacterized damage-inducible protein DinB
MATITQLLIEQTIYRVERNTPKIAKCLEQLTEEQIWLRPNDASNSVGNLLLHLCGNIRQYIISALGGQPDIRERDKEFSTMGGYTKTELFNKLSAILDEAKKIINAMDEKGLIRVYPVQGLNDTGVGIIINVTEHYSCHTGQIVFWTKLLTGNDPGFYTNTNLNKRNSS